MALIPTGDLLTAAWKAGRGVGAFNVIQIEHAEGIVAGAEKAQLPVIVQISENTVAYHGALSPIATATLEIAKRARIPVAVHLDHATNPDLVDESVALGFGSVMFDASALPYEENVTLTAEVAARARGQGVFVEAELGEVRGKDGVHAPGARTDPEEALVYVAATGVDALAVAVGSSHAMLTRDAALDFELIARLRAALQVPLVLHGSSGVPDEGLESAVRHGMTKINIATHLNKVFTEALTENIRQRPAKVDPRVYLGAARTAIADQVAYLLELINLSRG
ncbi:fructose-bisphosphate aldolase, class II [Sinosporangium album]|uniref:Fructose-bisphosphate aldolase, class II n=1 Tax=Sinosporangium album TaxID=504805 RepID=A0A1G7S747_9ACTN|nr:class II fructose-bisphosphate aldolase [Sinosporangium album]SDG18818.1 fructose-bisphosphate aldolase, class II [Sinosporangium album]